MIQRACVTFFLLWSWTGILLAGDSPSVDVARVIEYRVRDNGASKGDSTLTVTLSLKGEALKTALEAGDIEVAEAVDNLGNKLPVKTSNEQFAPLGKRLTGDDSGTLNLDLGAPGRNAESIKKLAGTLKIRTYRHQVVLIDNVLKKINQNIDNPLFKAHEFAVRVVDPRQALPGASDDEAESLRQRAVCIEISGEKDKVSGVELQTPDDKPIPTRASSFSAGRTANFTKQSDTPLPPDTVAKIFIAIDPQEVTIPFALENIALP
ncbi:MAG: hypothetical protein PHD76_03370 [Methylacidiphilales bacterium]|nr:hypothetical protein [Candidatus Methylacidiphilales bacterium]